MDYVVYKYIMSPAFELELSLHAKILHVGEQNGDAYIWIMTSPQDDRKRIVKFVAIPTGEPFYSGNKEFVGTVQFSNGFVFHIFKIVAMGL